MRRIVFFVYGLLCYLVFFGTFLYAIGFVGSFAVPKGIDDGAVGPVPQALLINVLLLSIFAIQHSVMARLSFKEKWTKIIPAPIERSTFVLLASLALILVYRFWQPMTGVVWAAETPIARSLLWGLFALGWLLVLLTTYMIDHFDLFGLRQVYLHLRGREYEQPPFQTSGLYNYLRHPLLLGFMIAFWSTPMMTTGHLLFALVTTAYMLVAIQLEERDLGKIHGDVYQTYRQQVHMFLPLSKADKSLGRMESTQAK